MHPNEELIRRLFHCFAGGDYRGIYAIGKQIVFRGPAKAPQKSGDPNNRF